jgi:hypothetical protein
MSVRFCIGSVIYVCAAAIASTAASIDLGAASGYAGLGLAGVPVTISSGSTVITGNIGIGQNGSLNFSGGGVINGAINFDSTATLTLTGGSTATGGEQVTNMAPIQTAALNAASSYAALAPTQTVGSIGNGASFTGSGGQNVIDVSNGISLSGGGQLTLTGGPNDTFVFDVSKGITFSGGSSIILMGLNANQILFNEVDNSALNFNGNSDVEGDFLAPTADITVSGGMDTAEFVSGTNLIFQSGPKITTPGPSVPEPSTYVLMTIGLTSLVGLTCLRRSAARNV